MSNWAFTGNSRAQASNTTGKTQVRFGSHILLHPGCCLHTSPALREVNASTHYKFGHWAFNMTCQNQTLYFSKKITVNMRPDTQFKRRECCILPFCQSSRRHQWFRGGKKSLLHACPKLNTLVWLRAEMPPGSMARTISLNVCHGAMQTFKLQLLCLRLGSSDVLFLKYCL